jgi:aspartate aminotransferase
MQRKRDIAYDCISAMFRCIKPRGAFYLFPDVTDSLAPGESTVQLAERILTQAHVAVVPGEAFGAGNHLRISYGVCEKILIEGLERLVALQRS